MKTNTGQKILLCIGVFFLMSAFFLLLWIWLEAEKLVTTKYTPQECSNLYRTLPQNVKSQYGGSEAFINSCVK